MSAYGVLIVDMPDIDPDRFELRHESDRASFDQHIRAARWQEAFWLLATRETLGSAVKLRFLQRYKDQIEPEHYGVMLYDAYVNAYEGLQFLTVEELLYLFNHEGVRYFGSVDASIVEHLADPLIVYRGYHDERRRLRLSWTTDEYNASFFALLRHKESGGEPRIIKGSIPKARVVVFVGKESQIIVNPTDVAIIEDYPVPYELWVRNGRADEFSKFYGYDCGSD